MSKANRNTVTLASSLVPGSAYSPAYPIIGVGASAATNKLLDDHPAFIAYSVARQLSNDYNNALIRVRRSSDNAEQDIGIAAGVLDESSLTDFVGANNGFIVTIYDQSGNGRDASQAIAASQPQIVNSGTVEKTNGKPTAKKVVSGTNLIWSTITTYDVPITHFIVGQLTASGQCLHDGSGAGNRHSWEVSGANEVMYAGVSLSGGAYATGQVLRSGLYDGASSILRRDGSEVATGNVGTHIMTGQCFGNNFISSQGAGDIQELIRYNSDKSADFASIESSINTFYSIY